MTEELKSARDWVLVENTAQAVFKHLDRIEDNRAALGNRWIWELLQNARDATSGEGVRIWIRVTETTCQFEHDGKPFTSQEVAHLVYHGSTKIEDLENIGQFGSGFLTTHLLSRLVSVAGQLENSSRFSFLLGACVAERFWAPSDTICSGKERSDTAIYGSQFFYCAGS